MSYSNYGYYALLAGILLVVYLLVRVVVGANRRFGRFAAWLVIILEAVASGFVVWWVVNNVPGLAESTIGQQLVLAIVGIVLAIFIGGGLVSALGKR